MRPAKSPIFEPFFHEAVLKKGSVKSRLILLIWKSFPFRGSSSFSRKKQIFV